VDDVQELAQLVIQRVRDRSDGIQAM